MLFLQQFPYALDCIAYVTELRHAVVRNIDSELFFQLKDYVDSIERIDVELLERAIQRNLLARQFLRSGNDIHHLLAQCIGFGLWRHVSNNMITPAPLSKDNFPAATSGPKTGIAGHVGIAPGERGKHAQRLRVPGPRSPEELFFGSVKQAAVPQTGDFPS